MAKDDEDDGLLARGRRYLKERAARRGKELEAKSAKAKADEEEKAARAPQAAPSSGTDGGQGGYGGKGDAYRKRKIDEQTGDMQPSAFKSSNQGQTGRSTATERRARDKRLNGVSI